MIQQYREANVPYLQHFETMQRPEGRSEQLGAAQEAFLSQSILLLHSKAPVITLRIMPALLSLDRVKQAAGKLVPAWSNRLIFVFISGHIELGLTFLTTLQSTATDAGLYWLGAGHQGERKAKNKEQRKKNIHKVGIHKVFRTWKEKFVFQQLLFAKGS